jgi:ferredoxin-thioredoxin reductase catalytic subunit
LFFIPKKYIIRKRKGRFNVKITLNPDAEVVKTVKEGLKRTGGYCPCVLKQSEDTKCMCKEFKEQIKDPDFEGYCHCMLYYKSK